MALAAPRVIGRYTLCGDIAAGGMATVHYGRLLGPAGFSRTVAIKRLHAQFARDPEFVSMFMDEARVAARIRHPNVVQTLDVVALEGELFLVMDYVSGESLSRLLRASLLKGQRVPLEVVSAIACGVLHGLHAAHEATAETGEPLGIVHRDVSPQNVLVGADGVPRVLDFGVAKAAGRVATTREGQLKGKFAYMASEQVRSGEVDRRTDIYATGVVLWEMLTLQRLFVGDNDAQLLNNVLKGRVQPPSAVTSGLPKELDEITLTALSTDPAGRFPDARRMALAIEAVVPVASATRLAGWVDGLAGAVISERAKSVARIESNSSSGPHQALHDVLKDSLTPTPAPAPALLLDAHPTLSSEPKSGIAMSQSSPPDLRLERTPRRRSHRLLYAVGTLLALVGLAWAGNRMMSQLRVNDAATKPPPSPVVQPTESASRSTTPSASAPPPSATVAAPVVSTLASASSAPLVSSAPIRAPRAPVKPRPPNPGAAAEPAGGPGGHCTIKSFVDESGIEQFIKECN